MKKCLLTFLCLWAAFSFADPPPTANHPLSADGSANVQPAQVNGHPLNLPAGSTVDGVLIGSGVPSSMESEQLNGSATATITWTTGKTFLRQTNPLIQSVVGYLPPAASYSAGRVITYHDPVTPDTVPYGVAWAPSGLDTLNGGTDPITAFIGPGTARFESDGATNWTRLDAHMSINLIEDSADPAKKVVLNVAAMPEGTTTVHIGAGTISDLLGTTTVRGIAKDVYIAVRTDGQPGTGTAEDPLDGSTAVKFDAIMDGLAANTRVILQRNATFLTNGLKWQDNSKGWRVKNGEYIQGNGATIKLATYPNSWVADAGNALHQKHIVVGTRYYESPISNVTIENLTIDANWQNLASPWTNKAINGYYLYCDSNVEMRNVNVTNQYGDIASATESFNSISGHSTVSVSENFVIDGGLFSSPQGDYCNGCSVIGYDATHILDGGCIKNTRVIGNFFPSASGSAWAKNIQIYDTYADGDVANFRVAGFYNDTGYLENIDIRRMTVVNGAFGIYFNEGADQTNVIKNITVDGNIFRVYNLGHTEFEPIKFAMVNPALFSNLKIHNNIISTSHTTDGAIEITGEITNVQVIGNTIDIPAGTEIYASKALPNGHLVAHNIKSTGLPVNLLHNVVNIPIDPNSSGSVDNQFNRNSSLIGALKLTGTFPGSSNKVLSYYFPSSYVVQSGDTLQYEVFTAETNARWFPSTYLVFGDASQTSGMLDQNGIEHAGGDIPAYGRGRWYWRKGDLTPYAGKTISKLIVLTNSGNAETLTHYWRNIRVVDSNGQCKSMIYSDFGSTPTINVLDSGITNNSCAPLTEVPTWNVGGTGDHVVNIFATTSDVLGIQSTGTESKSMGHMINRGSQGPFFDYGGNLHDWAYGLSSLGNFVLRHIDNASNVESTDAVNGDTMWSITTAQVETGPKVIALTPTTSPTPAAEGMIYSDSGDHHLYFYNGSAWKQLDNP